MKGEGKGIPRSFALTAALLSCMLLPAAAGATTRYAAPGGTAADTVCVTPEAPKCSIGAAAGGADVLPADEAVILPGNYSDTAGDLNGDALNPTDGVVQPSAGNVHGASGEPRPVITVNGLDSMFANPYGAFLMSATTLSDVEINAGAMASGAVTFGFGSSNSVVQRVVARSTRDGAITCNQSQGTIRDSVCLSSGSGGIGLGASNAIAGTYTDNVRNVTAIATGSNSFGAFYFYGTFGGPGPTYTISAKSLIAQGTAQDIRVRGSGTGTSVTMTLDHSDYDTAIDEDVSGGAASVTAPGTGAGNIIGAPMLAVDGYHEVSGSPTINAGATDGSSGSTDIDGQQRAIGTVDIGADEVASPTITALACNPESAPGGSTTTCTATVTDPMLGNPAPTGSVSFSSDVPGGSFGSGGTCNLSLLTMGQSSCQVTYSAGSGGAGTHDITAAYGGDTIHDGSVDEASVLFEDFESAPPPPTFVGSTQVVNPCSALRKKLRKAKKAHNTIKVRKLKKKLRKRCGIR
jgi:Bacterial Ig-like domain (group 3)